MKEKVFISYRRDDSMGQAGRIHDRLASELGRDLLFMDVDSIPLGANFAKVLREEVAKCDVLLAVIGPKWLDARDEKGNRRLDSPEDFVRIEIASALQRGIPVIPVLLEGTRVPKAEQLPEDMEGLALHNGLDVRHASFHNDMDKLIRGIKGHSGPPTQIAVGPSTLAPTSGALALEVGAADQKQTLYFTPGNGRTEWLKDHDGSPEMVVIPAGTFIMGSPATEPERESWQSGSESPQHPVTIANPFAVGRLLVTRQQFAEFVKATGYKAADDAADWSDGNWEHDQKASWRNPGFAQRDTHPVVCVNWHDAKAYAAWCAKTTGRPYRLLSEAEWEYAARAGTTTPFWCGASITTSDANYNGNYIYKGGGSKGEYRKRTVSANSYAPNPWGLYCVLGNVWEWCEDAWHDNYKGAPGDGSPWLEGGDASRRVLRGGSWNYGPGGLRSASRVGDSASVRSDGRGIRLGATLVG